MTMVTTKAIAKVAAVATGLAMATSMLSLAPIAHAATLTDAQVTSIINLLTTFGASSDTVANVKAALTGQPTTSGTTTGGTTSACTFTRDLTVGATGSDATSVLKAVRRSTSVERLAALLAALLAEQPAAQRTVR